jgi:hypothetical protein
LIIGLTVRERTGRKQIFYGCDLAHGECIIAESLIEDRSVRVSRLWDAKVVSEWRFVRRLKAAAGVAQGLLNLYLVRVDVRPLLR